MDLLDELKRKKLLNVDDGISNALAGNIIQVRCSLEDLYMHRNTPIPLCYRQLVNVTRDCQDVHDHASLGWNLVGKAGGKG
jgi:hypothetical protein